MGYRLPFTQSTIVRTLIGGFLLILIPVILLSTLSLGWSMEILQDQTSASYESSIQMVSDSFSDSLLSLQTSAATYLVDDESIRLSGMPWGRQALYKFAQFHSRLKLQFSSCFMDADIICAFPAQRVAVSAKNGVEAFLRYPLLEDLEQAAKDQPSWGLRPSFRDPEKTCFSILIGYVHAQQTRPVILIEISEEQLVEQISRLLLKNVGDQAAFFQDSRGGSALYDPKTILTSAAMDFLWGGWHNSGKTPTYIQSQDKRLRLVPIVMEDFQCVIGLAFDETELLAPVSFMRWLLISLLVFGSLFMASYLVRTYRRIYIPTQMLVNSMHSLALGDMGVRVKLTQKGEFGILAAQFNAMAVQLDQLMKEKILSENKLKSTQIKFLRSQINPHFLYNSLFCLYNLIESQDLENAADLTIYLGQFYRVGAHMDQQKLPLSQEVENILPYLKIHQIRMGGTLEFSFYIQPGLEGFEIPSLSLQSLVENAMTHAFNQIQGRAVLQIRAVEEEDWVILSVEDNGSGIEPPVKEEILRRLEEPEAEGEIHALQNVFGRMQLLFGREVTLSLEDVSPSGTRVALRIPNRKGGGRHV